VAACVAAPFDLRRRLFQGRVLPFDEEAAVIFGDLFGRARAAGRTPQLGDAQIAAVACKHGFTIATRDVRGFAHLGVPIVEPWSA
jgi:predicted nucleic acid-binding protein